MLIVNEAGLLQAVRRTHGRVSRVREVRRMSVLTMS